MAYNTTLSTLLDKHAPVIKFTTRKSKSSLWFTSTLRAFRAIVRHAENLYKRTHSALDWSSFKSLRNHYHKLILSAKKQYYSHLVSSSSENPLRPWQTVNRLLNRKSSSPLPSSTLVRQLCLFLHRQNFQTSDLSNQHFPCCVSTHTFSSINTSCFFLPSGRHQNLKSISCCSTLPTNRLIRTQYLLGFSKNVLLYSSPQSPTLLISPSAMVLSTPFLKNLQYLPPQEIYLGPICIQLHRPISNLSLISKIIERIVKVRLTDHLSSKNFSIPTSQPIANTTPLKLLSCTFMIIS